MTNRNVIILTSLSTTLSGIGCFGPNVASDADATTSATGETSSGPSTTTDGGETISATGTIPQEGSTSSTGDAPESSSSSGPESPSVCGDGMVDLGEQCDDGNDSDLDQCTTLCMVPTCADSMQSGTESDVDCGGSCQPCGLCQSCSQDNDCGADRKCSLLGQCTVIEDVAVNWVTNCAPGSQNGVVLSDLPAGLYRATAELSAGTVWNPPYNPPATGYLWEIQCPQVVFDELRTPVGIRYGNTEAAFDHLISPSEDFEHSGGDLVFYFADGNCLDNAGGTLFTLELICE
jgi:cysteine-rich repeat protein